MKKTKKIKGFTLVELAIVLVIVGLIVGGVLVGQDLIRAAELRNIIADKEKFQAAIHAFRNKYNAIPGDMRNAATLWGAAAVDPNNWMCYADINGAGATCNGNGDGRIMSIGEEVSLFQQLGNEGLFIHSDSIGSGGNDTMYPHPSFMSGVYRVYYFGNQDGSSNFFEGRYGNVFFLYGLVGSNTAPAITALEMKTLDEKMDDGKAISGQVVGFMKGYDDPNCTTTDDAAAEYDLSTTDAQCSVIFKNIF